MVDFLAVSFLVILYFIPAIVAGKKRNFASIFLLNLLTGWTILGWIGALIWACAAEAPRQTVLVQQPPRPAPVPAPVLSRPGTSAMAARTLPPPPLRALEAAPKPLDISTLAVPAPQAPPPSLADELERLFYLKEKGALTEAEYLLQKADMLA